MNLCYGDIVEYNHLRFMVVCSAVGTGLFGDRLWQAVLMDTRRTGIVGNVLTIGMSSEMKLIFSRRLR